MLCCKPQIRTEKTDTTQPLAAAALCRAHARRRFFELAYIAANARRGKNVAAISPIALEAVKRIDALFDIERAINDMSLHRDFGTAVL